MMLIGALKCSEGLAREAAKRNSLLLYALLATATEQASLIITFTMTSASAVLARIFDGLPRSQEVVGYVLCASNKLVLHVSKVAVDPSHRQRGIAKALVQVSMLPGRPSAVLLLVSRPRALFQIDLA